LLVVTEETNKTMEFEMLLLATLVGCNYAGTPHEL
jgi:hypothetical protein